MKKILAMVLSLALVATMAITGSIAYLQDTDEAVNVMTLGNVYIDQLEYELVRDKENNNTPVLGVEGTDFTADYGITRSYKLQPFTQEKPAYPAVYTNDKKDVAWDEFQQLWNGIGAPGSNDIFDDSVKNVVDKFVFVENTGKSDAYFRTLIAIETPESVDEDLLHYNMTTNNRYAWKVADGDGSYKYVQHVDGIENHLGYITVNGVRYQLYEAVHTEALKPGDISRPSLLQVYLDPEATNDDCAAFGNAWEILVISQAVQTAGFADAQTALNTAYGEVTTENAIEWFSNLNYIPGSEDEFLTVDEAEEVLNALAEGENITVEYGTDLMIPVTKETSSLDAKGAEMKLLGDSRENHDFSYFGFIPENGGDFTLENLTVSGKGFVEVGHYGQGGGNYTIKNLTIKDLEATLNVIDNPNKVAAAFAHYGNATMNDCVMTGTTFTNDPAYTAYDVGFVNGTKTTINGGEYGSMYLWAQSHVTINNAKVGTIDSCAITTKNLGKLTIGEGAVVGTINLIPAGSYKPALVIEDGATVDTINYNGTAYTQAEWLAATI